MQKDLTVGANMTQDPEQFHFAIKFDRTRQCLLLQELPKMCELKAMTARRDLSGAMGPAGSSMLGSELPRAGLLKHEAVARTGKVGPQLPVHKLR